MLCTYKINDVFTHTNIDKYTNVRYNMKSKSSLFELLEEFGRLKVLWDWLVESCDDLINLLLPARLGILAGLDRDKELSQGDVQHGQEVFRNLRKKKQKLNKSSGKRLTRVSATYNIEIRSSLEPKK